MAMKERKDGDRQRASLCADHTQVKRAGPKLEAGPTASAMEDRRGETPQATRAVARQRAPAVPFGREPPMPPSRCRTVLRQIGLASRRKGRRNNVSLLAVSETL